MSSPVVKKKKNSHKKPRGDNVRVSSAASVSSNRSSQSPDHDAFKLSRSFTAIGDEFSLKDEDFGIHSRPATSAASLRSVDLLPIGHNAEDRIVRRSLRSPSPPSERAVREIMNVWMIMIQEYVLYY